MSDLYRVIDPNNDVIADGVGIIEAVEAAFQHDGYGFEMIRNTTGKMIAVTSSKHLGNNPFNPERDGFALQPESSKVDDLEARLELAQMIYQEYGITGDAHARLPLLIEEIK